MRLTLAAALVLGTTGCSSLYDLAGGTPDGPQPYGGVLTYPAVCIGAGFAADGCKGMAYLPMYLSFALVDLPLSMVVDTLLLPITIPVRLLRG